MAALLAALFFATTLSFAVDLALEMDFRIPAQKLDLALVEFSRQARVQVITSADDVRNLRTEGATGRFTIPAALRVLLRGSGLSYRVIGESAVSIGRFSAAPNESPASSRAAAAESDDPIQPVGAEVPQDPGITSVPERDNTRESERTAFSEVVVTGTRLRVPRPVGSNLIIIDRDEIDRSGFATVQDVVRALPQNLRGGVSDFLTGSTDRETFSNTVEGNAPNLRGLGAGATLVLVNGRRLAPTGFEGIFTDITSIPLSAVERIEVLLDGASAIYGSDAVAGVVNIVLRQSYTGADTRLQIGSVTQGGAQEYQLGQSLGTGWSTGQGMFAYEYHRRDALPRAARSRSVHCDQQRFGGDNFCTGFSNPGTLITFDPNTFEQQTWAIPSGQDGSSLTPADFTAGTVNFGNSNEGVDLLPEQQRHSLSGFVTQSLGDRVTLQASGFFSRRDALRHGSAPIEFLTVTSDNPFYVNPTGGIDPVFLMYSFRDDFGSSIVEDTDIETYQTALTGTLKASERWLVTTDIGYSYETHDRFLHGSVDQAALALALADPDPATAFNPFGDGSHTNPATLDAIRGTATSTGDSNLWTAAATAEGPLWKLPGGDVRLVVGAEYRQHEFDNSAQRPGFPATFEQYKRELSAEFAEVLIPLARESNDRRGLNRLEISLAGRHEDYDDFGETTNPKLGLNWSPVAGLTFSGSWGTSFKAPFVLDVDESENISFIFPLPDPESEFGFSDTLVWVGGNADLKEETATTWNLAVDISPPTLPELNLRLSYFDIDFEDRIETLFDTFSALLDPAFADAVTRNPTPEQRAEVCARSTFQGNPDDCLDLPVAALVDARVSNAAKVRNRGFDLIGSYRLQTDDGSLAFQLNATYLTELARALRATSPLIDILGTPFNPIDFRLRGSVAWARGRFETTVFGNYVDSYSDTLSQPDRRIASWTTFDLATTYRLPFEESSMLADTTLALNVQNVLDKDPPFFNSSFGYDAVNADLLGRFITVQLRTSWGRESR